jgi:PAS domain S-box-containing protein
MDYKRMTKAELVRIIQDFQAVKKPVAPKPSRPSGKKEKTPDKIVKEAKRQEAEVMALLSGARAVLEYQDFEKTARALFDSCKQLIGAGAGYVALTSADEIENKLLFLDSGGLSCSVDPQLPMPIRGMRGEVYASGQAAYENDFPESAWAGLLPEGHSRLDNVLFAPLRIKGKVTGLLGLSNKAGGFTENDLRLAEAFGELAAIALHNSRTFEALEASEELFRVLALTAQDALITIDQQERILFWNQAAERMFGYLPEEILGMPVTVIVPKRFRKKPYSGFKADVLYDQKRSSWSNIETIGLRKDGSEFPTEFSLSRWRTREGTFVTIIIRDVSERKSMEERLQNHSIRIEQEIRERTAELLKANQALRESEGRLRLLSSKLLQAEEQERMRIAREIHDSLGQGLSAIKFGIENALLRLKEKGVDEAGLRPFRPLIGLTQNTLEEVRRIIMDLRPSTLDDIGIQATISWFCRQFEKIYSGIRIQKKIEVTEDRVPKDIKTVIFRVIQEALNNVAKHSRASRVDLSLRNKGGRLVLRVEDNGRGFNLLKAGSRKVLQEGFGLTSMQERVELSGGSFEIKAQEGLGTRIRAVWIAR